ncbi:putative late blight resistance protein homolog R1B-17 [Salvia miltiorrhiza]|uniref:putative late blight resistance protein homolog R1B-17 n=1 Tax=Salvia miltiorrhiza TaxID=226208 RepID=UPI0025AD5546|nr:putative late blight resistance protein homolog R1B-17 [Salvia miltiorrhiza]
MALDAFISLKLTIEDLIKNPFSSLSLAPPTQQILEFAYQQLHSSEEIARKLLLRTTTTLDLQIKVAVSKLLDTIRSLKTKHAPSGSSVRYIEFSAEEVKDLKQDIHSFAELFNTMYIAAAEEEEEDGDSSQIGLSGRKSKMIGLSDHYKELKYHLTRPASPMMILVLVGMAGIGKTTLAAQIFEDPDIVKHYDLRVWVKIGGKCQLKDIPRRILAKLNPDLSDRFLSKGENHEIARCLRENLKGKRYLIVLDDVWNKYMACHFYWSSRYKIFESEPFPYERNESRVLLTTRVHQAEEHNGHFPDYVSRLRFLNEEESWELLRENVFAEELCTSQFEKAGKKIAENCEGLPLMIVKVAELLSSKERTLQYWNEVAAEKNHQLFMDAYDGISKVLYSSYENLTELLKLCFLYMGVFRQNYEIPRGKLINMWSSDGFLEENAHEFPSPSAIECLNELVANNLVMIYQSNISPNSAVGEEQIKTCGLHSSFWYLCNREARETKFCCILKILNDSLGGDIQGQSRLAFHNNVLFGIKDVYESVEVHCASTSGLKLLRELDALTIRFYEFPLEVLELVQLRYLALTLNGELPVSISRLSNLQFLIVGSHLSIKSCRGPSFLPVEIWSMKEIKHIDVMYSDIPNPCGASLESLLTLSNVSAHSCSEEVFKAIPKLEKLGIRIELAYDDDVKLLSSLNQVSNLKELRSLKCVIVSPEIVPSPLAPLPNFPSTLRKLSLSGLGYPWEEMSKMALLLSLTVLKLQNYAFQGVKWEAREKFWSLQSLVIEDSDLVEWKVGSESMKSLKRLSLKHCYNLENIEWEYGRSPDRIHWACKDSLRKIEMVDCNPLGAEEMNKALPRWKKDALAVHCSWDDTKRKK